MIQSYQASELEWIIYMDIFTDKDRIVDEVMKTGDLEKVKLFFNGGFIFTRNNYVYAFQHNTAYIANFLYENGIKPDDNVYLEMLNDADISLSFNWLYSRGCKIPTKLRKIVEKDSVKYSYIKEWIDKKDRLEKNRRPEYIERDVENRSRRDRSERGNYKNTLEYVERDVQNNSRREHSLEKNER